MYLKSLEVQGFKSFPEKTVIRFGDDITAIVGPNGSGKSNISDAILWVMGEQSSKTLRGTKMEDVIFGGTENRRAVGFAEATLTLDNADRALMVDADEVMVTRRYYRSGDSEYYINRQSARLKDINEMFMDTGLGREGYSNIGQGRIDEILAVKSEDRREIFEEAAGISKFRHRKEETERKLAHTEDNLLRIGDKVSELEIQLEPLKSQAEKAKKYLNLKEQLQGIEVAVWLDTLDRLSAAAQKAEKDYNDASAELHRAHDELEGLYTSSERLSEQLRKKDAELETVRVRSNLLEAAHQQMDGQMAVLRGNIDNNRANVARFEEELSDQENRSGGIQTQIMQACQRIREIDETLQNQRNRITELQKELTTMTANAQGMTRQFLELRAKQTTLTAEIAGREADTRSLEDSIRHAEKRYAELQEDLDAGDIRRREAELALETCRSELHTAQQTVAAANNMISGYAMRQSGRIQKRNELEGQMRSINSQLDSVRAKLKVFRAMERDYENYQKSVRIVMQEAQRGGLHNIHGPVSRLIRTADEFTVAIEIALGGAMQQIVVESEADGKAAIGFLKRCGGGRATFLPLSTIQGRFLQENGLERASGFVGIASDLVTCDDRYRPIVGNLLGRTVIAENIDCAISMARQFRNRFKIVTLDGQVMNPGGSMTGGSINKESGILSRANELEKMTIHEKKLSQNREATEHQLKEAQRQAEEAEFQLTAARDELREAEDQVLRLQGQEKQCEILAQALQEAGTSSRREQSGIETRLQADTQRLCAQKAKLEVYRTQLAETSATLATLEGQESETSEKTNELTEQMTAEKTKAAALEAECATVQTHIADLRTLQTALEDDRVQKQSVVEAMNVDSIRLEQQIAELLKRQNQNRQEMNETQINLNQVLKERSETEAAKTKSERESQEKNKDILNRERACALLEQKKMSTAMEEKQIIDKLWDNYELTPGTAADKRGKIESVAAGNRLIAELKREISSLGTPNLGAIEEFTRVNERYTYLTEQRDDVLTSKRELETIIENIQKEMTTIFVEEFAKINRYFGETFEEMFGGGKGQLLLEDPEHPLTCGIEIRVQPPGKQLKTITLLSGGEKAFVAIALYFAILKVRPTPFCLLDEIDAALDDRNVERFASYLHNLSEKTQFIVITHRRGTMEASDVLYGVTMQEQGVSKLLRLDLNQMEQYLGITE